VVPVPVSPTATNADNPIVFFDITIGGSPAGRIKMELFMDRVPRTAAQGRRHWPQGRSTCVEHACLKLKSLIVSLYAPLHWFERILTAICFLCFLPSFGSVVFFPGSGKVVVKHQQCLRASQGVSGRLTCVFLGPVGGVLTQGVSGRLRKTTLFPILLSFFKRRYFVLLDSGEN